MRGQILKEASVLDEFGVKGDFDFSIYVIDALAVSECVQKVFAVLDAQFVDLLEVVQLLGNSLLVYRLLQFLLNQGVPLIFDLRDEGVASLPFEIVQVFHIIAVEKNDVSVPEFSCTVLSTMKLAPGKT